MKVGDEYPCSQVADSGADTRRGAFDIQTMAPSLTGLLEQEQVEMDDRISLSKQFPGGVAPDVMRAHRVKHQLFLRVRAHEKAHFYQGISTAGCLARTFSVNDLRHYIYQILAEVPQDSEIWVPLIRLASRASSGFPRLDMYVRTFQIADIVHAAIDGDPEAINHYPELTRQFFAEAEEPIASDIRFRLGQRYINEGSAKAAEWIYYLRDNPQSVTKAELDFESGPEIYRRALTFVRSLIPNIPLPGQLQALVLTADFALHPLFPAGLWPDIFNAEAGDSSYLAPGPRFVRVAELLPSVPRAAFLDKTALAAELVRKTQEALGWPHPDEVTRELTASIDEVLAAPSNAEAVRVWGKLHPARRMKTALELRMTDTFAFVPPINAALINEHDSVIPSGFLGSRYDPLNEQDRLLFTYTWFKSRLASQLVYARCPECPVRRDDRYLAEYIGVPEVPQRAGGGRFWHRFGRRSRDPGGHLDSRAGPDEACPELVSGRCRDAEGTAAARHEFLSCTMIDKHLSEHLGAEWRSRIRFFVSSESPGTHMLAPERPAGATD